MSYIFILVIPGLAQFLQLRLHLGLAFFAAAVFLWFFKLGWIVHIVSVIEAKTNAHWRNYTKLKEDNAELRSRIMLLEKSLLEEWEGTPEKLFSKAKKLQIKATERKRQEKTKEEYRRLCDLSISGDEILLNIEPAIIDEIEYACNRYKQAIARDIVIRLCAYLSWLIGPAECKETIRKVNKRLIDLSLVDDIGMDSTDSVDFIMFLEDILDYTISDEDAEKVFTLNDALSLIQEKMRPNNEA